MMPVLSPNTQAILLLTAPLIAGRGKTAAALLSPGEYKRLARHLREIQCQPADLLSPDAAEILRACQPVIDENRLQKLLGRGFLLSQVLERWHARAIWVVSRADTEYPRRLKSCLREDAPAVLYGCGSMALLDTGGLAIVGSRHVDDTLIDYTLAVGRLAAQAGRTLVSGCAKGVDQVAMRGALECGGKVCGVMADSLEKAAMNRAHRNPLLDGQLVLISPYDPSAGFNVGNAMQRNKLIYALADASLVVSADLNKGGTWAGATEQLDKLKFTPVFIRSTGKFSAGLDGLQKKGALSWPNPQDVNAFENVFNLAQSTPTTSSQIRLPLFSNDEPTTLVLHGSTPAPQAASDLSVSVGISDAQPSEPTLTLEESPSVMPDITPLDGTTESPQSNPPPAEILFSAVRATIQQLLNAPMKDVEVATVLDVSTTQAKTWLQRLVEEGVLEKEKKPVRYVLKAQCLFN